MLFRNGLNESNYKTYYPAVFAEHAKHDRSERYLYVPTYKLIDGLTREGFKVVGAKQSGGRTIENRAAAKHTVYLTHGNLDRANMLVGQEIPLLALQNSHGGQSSVNFLTSFFRLVCQNGLMTKTGENVESKVRHTVGMEENVLAAAYRVLNEFPEQIRQISEMKTVGLNREEQRFLAEGARNLLFDQEQVDLNMKQGVDIASRLLTARRWDDRKNDLWTTFNVIQENAIKGGIKVISQTESGDRRYAKTRAVEQIDRNTRLNQELMALAMKMSELKLGAA